MYVHEYLKRAAIIINYGRERTISFNRNLDNNENVVNNGMREILALE
jgi:hypothetical protein